MACGGSTPTFNGTISVSHDAGTCQNTVTIHIDAGCGDTGYTLKLHRGNAANPAVFGTGVIYTVTIPDGPISAQLFSYVDTPPCQRGDYHYQWSILCGGTQLDNGDDGSATSGGAATITFADVSNDPETCVVTTRAQISKPCGECAGTIKAYRKVGSPVTFDASEIIYTDTVPAGPLIGTQYTVTDSPGTGTVYYAWRVFRDTGGVDDEYDPGYIVNDCFTYDPFTTALPEGEMEKQIVLVNVTRGGDRGYEYTDYRVLNIQEQRMEWWIHKNGGCGAFRFLTHDDFPEIVTDTSESDSWEIHVRIKLAGEYTYTTWYRGIIRSVKMEEQGNELYSDIRGYGYLELLDNVQVQKEYPAGVSVSQVVNDIIDTYIEPDTRIRRPLDIDEDSNDSGVDNSPYIFTTPLHFECSALKALKFLAEIQGNREFGVDADGLIYFRTSITDIIYNFFLSKNIVKKISGGKTFIQANQVKVAGKSFGSRDYLQVRPDVTDVSNNGVYESPMEVPWVTGDQDASRWADNIIAKNKGQQRWSVFTWKGVTRRLDATNPIGRISIYGDDISNDRETYDVAKIQYVEGGWVTPTELREMGTSKINPDLDQQVLKATFYAGFYPRDLIEELEVRFKEQIEFLKGRHKQYRYPHDVTNLPLTGHLPGEILNYSHDVTNIDVTNNPTELQDLTNPRGLLLAWQSKQWTKLSPRRTFHNLPSRGLFIGEIVSLITDFTNAGFGVLYWWSGTAWAEMGSGSGGGSGASLSNSNPTTIQPDDIASPGVGAEASRYDHRHAITTDVALDITNSNAEGVSTSFSKADHGHKGILSIKVKGQAEINGYVDITANPPLKFEQSGNTVTGDIDPVFIRRDGTLPWQGDQSLDFHTIYDVTNPQTNYQVVHKKYVDDLITSITGATPISVTIRRPIKAVHLEDGGPIASQAFDAVSGISVSFTLDETQRVSIRAAGAMDRNGDAQEWNGAMGFVIDGGTPVPISRIRMRNREGADQLENLSISCEYPIILAAGAHTIELAWGTLTPPTFGDWVLLAGTDYPTILIVEYTSLETVIGSSSGRSARLFNYERCF